MPIHNVRASDQSEQARSGRPTLSRTIRGIDDRGAKQIWCSGFGSRSHSGERGRGRGADLRNRICRTRWDEGLLGHHLPDSVKVTILPVQRSLRHCDFLAIVATGFSWQDRALESHSPRGALLGEGRSAFFCNQVASRIAILARSSEIAYCKLLATLENTLLVLPPIKRTVPITRTRMTASITAYSAMS